MLFFFNSSRLSNFDPLLVFCLGQIEAEKRRKEDAIKFATARALLDSTLHERESAVAAERRARRRQSDAMNRRLKARQLAVDKFKTIDADGWVVNKAAVGQCLTPASIIMFACLLF